MESEAKVFSRRKILKSIGIAATAAIAEGILKPGIVRDSVKSIIEMPEVPMKHIPTPDPTFTPKSAPTIIPTKIPVETPYPNEIQAEPTLVVLKPDLHKSTEFTGYIPNEIPYWFKDNFPQMLEVFSSPILAGVSFTFGGLANNSITAMGGYTLDSENQRCIYTATHILKTYQSMGERGMMLTIPDFNSKLYRHFITSDLTSFEPYNTNNDGFAFSKIVPGSSLDNYLAQSEEQGLISPVNLQNINEPLEESDSAYVFRPDVGWLKGKINHSSGYSSKSWGIYMVEHEKPVGAYRDGLSGSTIFSEGGLAIGILTNGLSKQDMRPELEQWHYPDGYGKNNPEFVYSNIMIFRTAAACFSPELS